jgi:hypothetical protein
MLEEASIVLENDINSLNCGKSSLKIVIYKIHINIVEQYTVNSHEKSHLLNVPYRSLENSEDKLRKSLKQNLTDDIYI